MNTNVVREMESEASMRCEVQAKTINKLLEESKQQAEYIVLLQNRCYAQSRGFLCLFCNIRKTCKSGPTQLLKGEL